MNTIERRHAVVLGGSIAGLFSARILSDHFEKVTIIERDPVSDKPESRKGQPQTRHLHGVLIPAHRFVQNYLPDAERALLDGGALEGDFGADVRWWQFGGYRTSEHMGISGISLSRPFFEYSIRHSVLAISNVELHDNTAADDLILDEQKQSVTGVIVTDRTTRDSREIDADLVIDARGRGTSLPKWLSANGFIAPEEEKVKIGVNYATRNYRRHGEHIDNPRLYMIAVTPPEEKLGAFMFPTEDGHWIVTGGGWHGAQASTDEAGFLEFLRNLPVQDIYDIVKDSEPVSDTITHSFPASRWYRYDGLAEFPDGILPLGDAVASFNPIYGQGMSSVALQVEALNELLVRTDSSSIWRKFFKRQSKIISLPWQLAVGEDFRYPETEGKKPLGIDLINSYVAMVHKATHTDKVVYEQFLRVMHLIDQPTSLMHPRILWRVLKANFLSPTVSHPADPESLAQGHGV